ncbi:hypothetical protein [Capnocytophaga cynodegmi]|uniref:hypothetical protein n=1 Tax=Capnocytophaga cynodegmi TaxID=28189 RepID=UPI00385F8883
MEKQMFKKGDRVFVYGLGWVVIEKVAELYVVICKTYSEKDSFFTIPNELVSFTEYTLQGNSQERLIDYNDYIGKWGKFWDNVNTENFVIGKLSEINDDLFSCREDWSDFDNFEPLTEEQIKILELK